MYEQLNTEIGRYQNVGKSTNPNGLSYTELHFTYKQINKKMKNEVGHDIDIDANVNLCVSFYNIKFMTHENIRLQRANRLAAYQAGWMSMSDIVILEGLSLKVS
jgi:hypothetical protein